MFLLHHQTNQKQNELCDDFAHELGKQITDNDQKLHSMDFTEPKINKNEKKLKTELYDLIEYVKWITNRTTELRRRVRAAEKVISDLRKSGESSVESLLDTLFVLRKKQEKLDREA